MSFQTERPKSTAEMIAELKESKLERKSNRKALLENYNAKKLSDDRQSVLEATQAETEEKALTEEHIESIRDRRREERAVKEASLNRLTLLESAKKITMNKVLFEMVYDAYWLDDNVKRESIQETYNEYRNVLGLVENVCGGSKTKDGDKTEFIKNVESVVEEACKKAVDRIIKEQKESGEPTKEFEFTSEEESDLDKKLSELGRDEIVDLVKKKVLTVVQDERKSGKEKAEMLKELDKTEDKESNEDTSTSNDAGNDDSESNDTVMEGAFALAGLAVGAGVAAIWTYCIGSIIRDIKMDKDDQIDLKKSLKIYEAKEDPKIKFSSLSKKSYVLDRRNRPTDKELTGISKFFNKNSRRANVYKSPSGEIICSNILYSEDTTRMDDDGNAHHMDDFTTTHHLFYVNPKYKKDAAYLCASMNLAENTWNKSTDKFIDISEKKYPEEFKNTKVRGYGKALEGTEYDDDFEPVEEGVVADWFKKKTNKLKAALTYTRVSKGSKTKTRDKAIVDAALRIYEKYESPECKLEDLKFETFTKDFTEHAYSRLDLKDTGIELSRVDSMIATLDQRSNKVLTVTVIYDTDEKTGTVSTKGYPCVNLSTMDDYFVHTAFYNKKFVVDEGMIDRIGCIKKFVSYVNEKYPEEMKKEMRKTVTEGTEYDDGFEPVEEFNEFGNRPRFGEGRGMDNPEKGENNSNKNNIDRERLKELDKPLNYKKPISENYKATLESMIAQKQRRTLRNSMGGTLFESFMIANSNSIRDEAIMEGMDVDTESTMNAALIETILQYTVLETLNTTKLYNFTSADVAKIKAHNRSTLRN